MLAIVAAGAGAYVLARETSLFAVRAIQVTGAGPEVGSHVQSALAPLLGASLVSLDRGEVRRRVLSLPDVAAVSVDRDFPHTLRLSVRPERPVAVARQGRLAWLVAADGRVVQELARPYPHLPRAWLPRVAQVSVGATLGGEPGAAIRAIAPLAALRFPAEVRSVAIDEGDLELRLSSGTIVRLGDSGDLRLKLAVAKRILPLVPGAAYVDVSVPERAVADSNPQVVG